MVMGDYRYEKDYKPRIKKFYIILYAFGLMALCDVVYFCAFFTVCTCEFTMKKCLRNQKPSIRSK